MTDDSVLNIEVCPLFQAMLSTEFNLGLDKMSCLKRNLSSIEVSLLVRLHCLLDLGTLHILQSHIIILSCQHVIRSLCVCHLCIHTTKFRWTVL